MPNHPRFPISSPRRIVIRGVNWLGDAAMTTPALVRLRERFPEAHLALLTLEKLRDLWRHHGAVNETIAIESGQGLFSVGRKLRAGQFDLALVLPNSPRSALEVWLAGIPRRIGYARPWRNCLLTQAVPTRPGHAEMRKRSVAEVKQLVVPRQSSSDAAPASEGKETSRTSALRSNAHQIHEYLHLVGALGAETKPLAPTLAVMPEELTAVRQKFELDQISNPIFGLCPGAEYGPAKRWPTDRFIAAALEIYQQTNCTWLIFGTSADAEIAARVAYGLTRQMTRGTIAFNLAGKTSLRELMSLLKLCRVLLTNDTGSMHVAAALGTPVVVPFGSTTPELTGPGLPGDPHHYLLQSGAACAPCFRRECPIDFRCMNDIPVSRVAAAVLETSNR
jgi:lipopolysaccharide heptosyltransferase II